MKKIFPIKYIYDPEDEDKRQQVILDQVKSFCAIPEKQTDAETWNYIWQAIRRISLMTCWAERDDDTFLLQVRKQQYNAKQVNKCCRGCCRCDDDIIKIPLEYEPVERHEYVYGKITVVVNGNILTEDIDAEYLDEHTDWETGMLYINREDFPDILLYKGCCFCLCDRDVRITLVYNAGYKSIPNGLLPVICALIEKVDTDTTDQCATAMTEVSGLLKRKKVGNVEYEWDTNDASKYSQDKLLAELNNLGLLGEVMVYSRCWSAKPDEETGDVV